MWDDDVFQVERLVAERRRIFEENRRKEEAELDKLKDLDVVKRTIVEEEKRKLLQM